MLDKHFPLYIFVFIMAFVITATAEKILIPALSKKAKQPIYEEGPSWHIKKSGTPTMGGVAFLLAACISILTASLFSLFFISSATAISLVISLLYAVSNALIGVFDDLKKLKRKENAGLTPKQKILLQLACALIFLFLRRFFLDDTTTFSFSFGEIYNHIKVYGQIIETDRDSTSCTYTNNVYNASFDLLSALENNTTYSITIPSSNLPNAKLNINNLGAKDIVIDDKKPITSGVMLSGKYSFRYRKLYDDFLLLGKYQVFGEAYNHNPNHPFSINSLGYEKEKILQDSEYESLYSDDLAKQMAEYELYLSSNLAENISLEMINIPWLDVNCKIEYTSKNFNETHSYIIKSISGSTSSATMTVSMIKYYVDYSET